MRHELQHWNKITMSVEIVTAGAGISGLSPIAKIRRNSDGKWLSGNTWTASTSGQVMGQTDVVALPGMYFIDVPLVALDYAAGASGYTCVIYETSTTLLEHIRIDQLIRPSWEEPRASFIGAGTFGEASQEATPTISQIVAGVWDVTTVSHSTAGTMGREVGLIGGLPSLSAIAGSVWDEPLGGHSGTGTTGEGLIASAALTSGAVAEAVWDVDLTVHATAGSSGATLSTAGGVASPASIAAAVWDESKSSHASPGTFGRTLQVVGGLVQHNHRLKSPIYDIKGRMLSATLAVYTSGTDAASDANALASINVTMAYDGDGNLISLLSRE